MGKISPVSGKYIIHASIKIDGTVEKPDVIGAIFGQTEGLLGADLELRELQRSGRIGRIEVNTTTKGGKVDGEIIIPSSLDKAETAIIAAALEIIERIGPCNADIRVTNIEDIRVSKRKHVIERAKELLHNMIESVIPDSQEIAEEVGESVRVMEVTTYGDDKLPAGPAVLDSEEVIIVEGRADVLTLLKYGFKNAIAMNGSSVPETIIKLSKEKTVIAFVDGDRGGDLNIKELISVAEIDFAARAPDGKEVEELTQKEIHKALRGKMTPEQFIAESASRGDYKNFKKQSVKNDRDKNDRTDKRPMRPDNRTENRPDARNDRNDRNNDRNDKRPIRPDARNDRNDKPIRNDDMDRRKPFTKKSLTDIERESFAASIQELLGTKGAALLDENANVLGKVPIKELTSTLKSLKGSVYAVTLDGSIDKDLLESCDEAKVKFIIGMELSVDPNKSKVSAYSASDLE